MGEPMRKHFTKILTGWKQELMVGVDKTVDHMKEEAANFADPADRASQEEEFALELRNRDRERKLIKKIDKTLQKIQDEEYGWCESCGIEIGLRRLEARPTADLCFDCKEIAEKRKNGRQRLIFLPPERGASCAPFHLYAQPDHDRLQLHRALRPHPSGFLHFGSLVAALASWLDARAVNGRWLLRMEDTDPPREMPGARDAILQTLERYGLHWDGEVVFQSQRHDAYAAVVDRLFNMGLAYACTCSRKQLERYNGIYPGFCRNAGHAREGRPSACGCQS